VPVVFATGTDPVRDGLVASLNRPGANFTGVIFITSELGTKRLEVLRQLAPKATTVAMLVMPSGNETAVERVDVAKAAQVLGLQLVVADATMIRPRAALAHVPAHLGRADHDHQPRGPRDLEACVEDAGRDRRVRQSVQIWI
jgi:ABC-type uncharacterized transport system substrate-binding protein